MYQTTPHTHPYPRYVLLLLVSLPVLCFVSSCFSLTAESVHSLSFAYFVLVSVTPYSYVAFVIEVSG